MGQLGNQMFIIATAESLALDNGAKATFPDLLTSRNWNIQENREKIFFRVNSKPPKSKIKRGYVEPNFHYQKIPYQSSVKLNGYFQSEKYFCHNKSKIIELFSPSFEYKEYIHNKFKEILSHPKTVAIHFRDYLSEDPEQIHHLNCTLEYYQRAIKMFPEDSLFVVCSNNIEWCKDTFSNFEHNIIFIEGEHFHIDFFLMSMCKHNIISNSTFSWWAAYLNRNPNKVVVAPRNWLVSSYVSNVGDVVPEDWIKIE